MEQEDILQVIDKLTGAKITLTELEEIKPLIGTDDFTETYELVQTMETALQPLGRAELKKELQETAKQYHEEQKTVRLRKINRWILPAVAACVLVICSVSVVHKLTDYNNPRNFSKAYSQNIK